MPKVIREYIYETVLKDLGVTKKAYLVPLADFHLGCRDTDLDTIQGYVDWILNEPLAYTIFNGDLMNCAGKDTKPELYDDLVTPDMAYGQLREIVKPLADAGKVLMIDRGTHEGMIFAKAGVDYMARLADDLHVPYHPDGGMVGIKMSTDPLHKTIFWVYATHGWGAARTIGAKVNQIEDLVKVAEADIYVLSHNHTQAIHRLNSLVPGRISWKHPTYMVTRRKLMINTGGFIKYAGYVQRKGYTPQDLGTPRIRMEIKLDTDHNITKDLHASI